jgi:hypothetical protein
MMIVKRTNKTIDKSGLIEPTTTSQMKTAKKNITQPPLREF